MPNDFISPFRLLFLLALALSLGIRLWLARRQMAHVFAHRPAVPAEFADRIALAAHQKAADYTRARGGLGIYQTLAETALLLVFTLGGGLEALHGFWSSHLVAPGATPGYAYGIALIFSVTVISSLVDLPFGLYRQFVLEQRFGFNRMSLGLFFGDLLKSTLIGALIGTPVLLAVLWLMAHMGAYWWFYVWLFWSAFNLLLLFIYPTWIAPLFNKFTPLEDGELKDRILGLLSRCGFAASGLFVMDGSKRSAHGNAYFTGFGNNKRIVFSTPSSTGSPPGKRKRCWPTNWATSSGATSCSASSSSSSCPWAFSGCWASLSAPPGSMPAWGFKPRTRPWP